MLTPTAKAAVSPALSIMQSIVTDQTRMRESNQPEATGATPNVAVTPGYSAQATEKLNSYYFGDHQSVSEVRVKIFNYLAQYVGKQIDAVEKDIAGGQALDTPGASQQLAQNLKGMDADVRGGLRSSLNDYAEGRQSLQATAMKMLMTIDLDVLSNDRKVSKYLKQMIGFDLRGMSAQDILKAFVDPDGKENDKLRSIISNALAGEEGSKTMQRLDDAANGLRSVAETRRQIEDVKPYDEVDEETKEEDKKDIKTAKAYDTLTKTRDFIDAVAEENVELAEAKAEIEAAAESAGKPAGTSTPPVADEGTGSDASEADGKEKAANRVWGYWDPAEQSGTPHPESEPLYF